MSEGVEVFVQELATQRGVSTEVIERDFFETIRPSSLLKRFATAEEVAALVTFVASPRASATNGAALRVEGGSNAFHPLKIAIEHESRFDPRANW